MVMMIMMMMVTMIMVVEVIMMVELMMKMMTGKVMPIYQCIIERQIE